jgi:hypothetical protein
MKKPKAATGRHELAGPEPVHPESVRRELGRREFLRTLGTGAAMVATAEGFAAEAHADSSGYQDRSKARYQPDSRNIQEFYRVNRYPPKRG